MSMNPAELMEFLNQGRVGVLSTIRKDGSPQVSPVWFRYDGTTINIWTEKSRIWVKNVEMDGRVAFSVQEERPPFAAVLIRGNAHVSHQLDDSGLQEAKDISRLYIEESQLDKYVESSWPDLHTFVRIVPEHVRSWKRGY